MALGYRENADKFADKNIVVYGMNDKDAESARAWIEKEGLPFSVLLDPDWSVGMAYGMSEATAERYVANNAEGPPPRCGHRRERPRRGVGARHERRGADRRTDSAALRGIHETTSP